MTSGGTHWSTQEKRWQLLLFSVLLATHAVQSSTALHCSQQEPPRLGTLGISVEKFPYGTTCVMVVQESWGGGASGARPSKETG